MRRDWIRRLIDLGVTDGMPPPEARCVKLVNAVTVLGVISVIGSLCVAHSVDLWFLTLNLLGLLVCAASLVLNAFGRALMAQLALAAFTVVATVAQGINLGLGSGIQYYLLPIAFIPFFVFPRRRIGLALGFSVVSAGAFAASAWVAELLPQASVDALYYGFSLSMVAVVTTTVGAYARAVALAAEEQLARQQADNEALVRRVLPAPEVTALRSGASTAIHVYDEAVVIHAEVAGLGALTEALGEVVVDLLGELFAECDEVCARHGATRLATVGGAYVAAAGVPDRARSAADRAVRAAIEMQAAARMLRERHGLALELRVGVTCGAVAAGIVGKQRTGLEVCGEALARAEALAGTSTGVTVDAATRERASRAKFVDDGGRWRVA